MKSFRPDSSPPSTGSSCSSPLNPLDHFILETHSNINDAKCFFEQHSDITDINLLIELYIKINKLECHICYEKFDTLYMFIPCGHRIICKNCAELFQSKYNECINNNIDKCPICRENWITISDKSPLCISPKINNLSQNNDINLLFVNIYHDITPLNISNKICKFYKNGFCVRGNNCRFRHLSYYNSIQHSPTFDNYCKHFFRKGYCFYGSSCSFLHDSPF